MGAARPQEETVRRCLCCNRTLPIDEFIARWASGERAYRHCHACRRDRARERDRQRRLRIRDGVPAEALRTQDQKHGGQEWRPRKHDFIEQALCERVLLEGVTVGEKLWLQGCADLAANRTTIDALIASWKGEDCG